MSLILKDTLKYNLKNIDITPNQLIYCIDTKESYYDNISGERVYVGDIIYIDTETDRTSIIVPTNNFYFVKSTSILYKYNSGWVAYTVNYDTILSNISSDLTLIPVTLKRNGKKIAPRTFVDLVYTKDGKSLIDIISSIQLNTTTTHSSSITATTNNQSIFIIPYPTTPYDLTKNIMIIKYNGDILYPDSYIISTDGTTVTLGIDIPLGGVVDFEFRYSGSDVDTNAVSINNVRFFVTKPSIPQVTDILFDIVNRSISFFDGEDWINLGSGSSNGLIMKRSVTTLTNNTFSIPINIAEFNKNNDSLLVFQNSTFLDEGTDYTISDDSSHINSTSSWGASSEDPIIVSIICLKNLPLKEGKFSGLDIQPGTIPEEALCATVINKLNRNWLTQSQLDNAISGLKGTVSTDFDTLKKIQDILGSNTVISDIYNRMDGIDLLISGLLDSIKNKLNITVSTSDNSSAQDQTITIINNNNNTGVDYNVPISGILNIVLDKFTSYTITIDSKSGYTTPTNKIFNSGHLGDITNLSLIYQKI